MRFAATWQTPAASAGRFRAVFEAAGFGLILGLVDVQSTGTGAWFLLVYLVVAYALGVRHGVRSWQAWIPLGASVYLAHLAGIACGYKPPYVAANAREAWGSSSFLGPPRLRLLSVPLFGLHSTLPHGCESVAAKTWNLLWIDALQMAGQELKALNCNQACRHLHQRKPPARWCAAGSRFGG